LAPTVGLGKTIPILKFYLEIQFMLFLVFHTTVHHS
jgi:hypothetical protein